MCEYAASNAALHNIEKKNLTGARYYIYSSKRHIRPLRTILFGGLGLGLGVLGVVRVWVSMGVRVGVALVRGWGQGQFGGRVRVGLGLLLG